MLLADLKSNIFHICQGKTPGLESFSAFLQNQTISVIAGLMGNGFRLQWGPSKTQRYNAPDFMSFPYVQKC